MLGCSVDLVIIECFVIKRLENESSIVKLFLAIDFSVTKLTQNRMEQKKQMPLLTSMHNMSISHYEDF